METKKYWIRFTLLTLVPVFLGLIIGLLVVQVGNENCVDEADLRHCHDELQAVDSTLQEIKSDELLLARLHRSVQAAEGEIKKLEVELSRFHNYWTAATVDSIKEATMLGIIGHFSAVSETGTPPEIHRSLVDYYKGRANQLASNTRALLDGLVADRGENEHIQSLELKVEAVKNELQEAEDLVERKEREIVNLQARLESKDCPPCPTHSCDHSTCQVTIDSTAYSAQIRQIEGFIADLDQIKDLTGWVGDGKIRDQLAKRRAEYEKKLAALKEKLGNRVVSSPK